MIMAVTPEYEFLSGCALSTTAY